MATETNSGEAQLASRWVSLGAAIIKLLVAEVSTVAAKGEASDLTMDSVKCFVHDGFEHRYRTQFLLGGVKVTLLSPWRFDIAENDQVVVVGKRKNGIEAIVCQNLTQETEWPNRKRFLRLFVAFIALAVASVPVVFFANFYMGSLDRLVEQLHRNMINGIALVCFSIFLTSIWVGLIYLGSRKYVWQYFRAKRVLRRFQRKEMMQKADLDSL